LIFIDQKNIREDLEIFLCVALRPRIGVNFRLKIKVWEIKIVSTKLKNKISRKDAEAQRLAKKEIIKKSLKFYKTLAYLSVCVFA
jgi:hypothetical protein